MIEATKPRCYKSEGGLPHFGPENWDEFCWLDPFICTGCGIDFSIHADSGPPMNGKICGRRYGNIVMVAYICGCPRTRYSLVILDDDDCIASHHTVSDADLLNHWPEIAPFYIEDDDFDHYGDNDYDPVAEEREYWPEWNRKYHRQLAAREVNHATE